MTNEQIKNAQRKIRNTVTTHHEQKELESLVSVLGAPTAQHAAEKHRLPELIAREQGHGMDHAA